MKALWEKLKSIQWTKAKVILLFTATSTLLGKLGYSFLTDEQRQAVIDFLGLVLPLLGM